MALQFLLSPMPQACHVNVGTLPWSARVLGLGGGADVGWPNGSNL